MSDQQTMTSAQMRAEIDALQRETIERTKRIRDEAPPDSPTRARAEALLDEMQQQQAEREDTAEAAGGADAMDRNMQALDALRREHQHQRNAREAQLRELGRYSDEGIAQMMSEWDAQQQAEAEALARSAWAAYERASAAAQRDIQTAHRENEARFDLGRVGVLVKDYGAQLQAPPIPQGMEGDRAHRLRFVEQLLSRAEASGDPDAARAARIAAGPVVREMLGTGSGEADVLSRDLHRRLAGMAEAERGRVVQVEASQRQLAKRGQVLRQSILGAEQATTGRGGGIFGLSPWQVAILGESPEDFGGGVVEMVSR